jgi:hypothetical protein
LVFGYQDDPEAEGSPGVAVTPDGQLVHANLKTLSSGERILDNTHITRQFELPKPIDVYPRNGQYMDFLQLLRGLADGSVLPVHL